MEHHLKCPGTTTYTVIDLLNGEQSRQCDNCGAYVVEPVPVERECEVTAAKIEQDICNGGRP